MSRAATVLRAWSARFAAAVVLLAVAYLLHVDDDPDREPSPYVLELRLQTDATGRAQVFYDRGDGFRQEESSSLAVAGGATPEPLRFPVGAGAVRRLRVDPLNGILHGTATVSDLRLLDTRTGRLVRAIAVEALQPNDHVGAYRIDGDRLVLETRPGADDLQLVATFSPALQLGPTRLERLGVRAPLLLALLGALVGVAWLIDVLRAGAVGSREPAGWRELPRTHPRTTIAATALVATVVCCHPLIFAGRSLVSPDYGVALMHPAHCGVGGNEHGRTNDHGSDIGAMLWQHLPYSVVQHRALARDGAWPWWNRYNSCGVELFGQGQSMLGDPFHLPVLLSGGAAWAWDARFVAARLTFAVGIGFLAFAATRHTATSVLLAASAPFIGFFSFRLNHPAVFTVCVSPWVLTAWLEIARDAAARRAASWFVLVVAANGCLLTSGTVKEAAMTAVVLNGAGLIAALLARPTGRERARLAAIALGLALGGALVAAPWWLAFFRTLGASWTAYDAAYALRLPPARLAGLFDGMLYSEFFPDRTAYAPSANFVVLLGILLGVAQGRRVLGDRQVLVLGAAAFAALSLAFDTPWVPDSWILAVPGLRHVGHVGNTFSCVALPLLFALAAKGWCAAMQDRAGVPTRRAARGWIVGAGAAVLLAPLLWSLARTWTTAAPGSSGTWMVFQEHGYFFGALAAMIAGWALLPLAHRWMSGHGGHAGTSGAGAGALLLAAALLPALARHGQTLLEGHDDFFVRPARRADLAAASPALTSLQAQAGAPFRIVGLDDHLVAGYTAVHGLESPNGPDALANRWYRELTEAAGLAPRADWYFSTQPDVIDKHRRLLDMLNVRYYAACPAGPEAPAWMRTVVMQDLHILESPGAWPRAFFVDRAGPCATAADVMHELTTGDGRPFVAVPPSELRAGDPTGPAAGPRTIVPATDYRLTNNSTEFTIETPGPGWVVLTEAWLPKAFAATIDGEPTGIIRVNHAFRGVRVDAAGRFRLAFTYRPPAQLASAVLPILGVGIIGGTLGALRRAGGGRP